MDAGCDDFLTKPFHIQRLWNILKAQLHIQWIYEEKTERKIEGEEIPYDEISLEYLSDEYYDKLWELAHRGSAKRFHSTLDKLEKEDGKLTPLIKKLRNLANIYQFDEIIEVLHKL
jgi:hypothetical protein